MPTDKQKVLALIKALPDDVSTGAIISHLLYAKHTRDLSPKGPYPSMAEAARIRKVSNAYSKAKFIGIAKRLGVDISDVKTGYKLTIVGKIMQAGYSFEDMKKAGKGLI